MLETLPGDVEAADGDQLPVLGACVAGGGGGGGGGDGGGGAGGGGGAWAAAWLLSPGALARINARLPQEVRLFGGVRVRKKFDARE